MGTRSPKGKGKFLGKNVAAHCEVMGHSTVSCAKTAELIEIPFWMKTQVGRRNHVLHGVQIPQGEGTILWDYRVEKSWLNFGSDPNIYSRHFMILILLIVPYRLCLIRCDSVVATVQKDVVGTETKGDMTWGPIYKKILGKILCLS